MKRSLHSQDLSHISYRVCHTRDSISMKSLTQQEDMATVYFNLYLDSLLHSFATVGFQATQLARAITEVNRMLKWRQSDEPRDDDDEPDHVRAKVKCTIFLGYTSNMISCGVRECLRYIAQHNLVSCMVTTCGGIEEDFLKCWNPHYVGDFTHNGRELRLKGQNRIANLVVPNKNYCQFEDWIMPILDAMLEEQKKKGCAVDALSTD